MEINLDSLVFNESYIQFDALYLNGKYYKKNVLSTRLFTLCLLKVKQNTIYYNNDAF